MKFSSLFIIVGLVALLAYAAQDNTKTNHRTPIIVTGDASTTGDYSSAVTGNGNTIIIKPLDQPAH